MKTKRRKAPKASRRGHTRADRVKVGQKSQKKGADFEVLFGEFIGRLTRQFGLLPIENRRQQAGLQFGRDWHFWWRKPDGAEVRWFFQCKDKKEILWPELAGDLETVQKGPHEIDYWVLVSPSGRLTDPAREQIEAAEQGHRYKFHIKCWTVDRNVETLFALDPTIYKKIYHVAPSWSSDKEKGWWRKHWKEELTPGPVAGAFNKAYYIDALYKERKRNRIDYIPLQARLSEKGSQKGSAPEGTNGNTPRWAAVLSLLESGESLLLVGEFGSGKTFALEEHVLNLCRSTLGDPEEERQKVPLPIFISLKRYRPTSRLWTLIARAIGNHQQVKFEQAHTERLLRSYPSVVFFDGFNEVPSANQEELEDELTTFIQNFSNVQVILTSRPWAAPTKLIDLPIYAVQPLPWHQVEEEIQKQHVPRGGEFCRIGDERFKTLRAMLTNPFTLVAFLTWLQTNREVPTQEVPATVRDLYETLLEKRIKKTQNRRELFDRALTHRILTQAGLKMTEGDGVGMQEADFWNGVMAEMPIPLRRSSQEVVEDVVATGILDLRDEYVSFFHEEIQYYYGGPALLAEQPLLDEILKDRKYDDAVIHGILSFTGQERWLKLERVAECDPDLAKKLLRYVTLDKITQHRLEDLALRWLADSRQPFGLKARWASLLQALYPGGDIQHRFPQDASGKPIDWQNLLNRPRPFGIFLEEDLQELMDEIDEVLEENAEEFVKSYRIPGPPPWKARREPHLMPLSRIRPAQFTDPSRRDLLTLGIQLLKASPDRQPHLDEYMMFLGNAQYARASHTEPMFSVGVRVAAKYCCQLFRLFQARRDYHRSDLKNLARWLRLYPCREAVAPLTELLRDEDGEIAQFAGQGLFAMGTPSARKALLAALEDANPSVRSRSAEVLSRVPMQAVFKRLYSRLNSETDATVISALLGSLSMHEPDGVAAFVLRRLRDRKEARKALLLDAVLKAPLMQKTIRPVLTESLKNHDLTKQALEYLRYHPDPELKDILLSLLGKDREEIVAATLGAISEVGEPGLATRILPFLDHPSSEVRREATFAFYSIIKRAGDDESARHQVLELGGETLRSRICTLLTELTDPGVCQGAIYATQALKLAEARNQLLVILATSQDSLLIQNAGEALQKIVPGDAASLFEILNPVGNSGEEQDPLFDKRIEETLELLRAWKSPAAVVPIMRLFENWPSELFALGRFMVAVQCLSEIGTDEAVEALRQLAVGRARQERSPRFDPLDATIYELDALAEIGSDKARTTLLELFRDLLPPWRKGAAVALAKSGDSTTIDALLPTLADPVFKDDAYDVIDAIERRLRIRRLTHLKFFSTGNQTTEGQR